MVGLPHADLATVDESKVTHYLLATDHPAGRGKAAFFDRFGFSKTDAGILCEALLGHARSAPVSAVEETDFGRKYVLDGPLIAPDGRQPRVRAIWFIEAGETAPRF